MSFITKSKCGTALVTLLILLSKTSSASIVTSDFSFGSGIPFGGTTVLGGVEVSLTTTNTEPFGSSSFRDQLNTGPATVTFEFSESIQYFQLDISFVLPPDEFISEFNIGLPNEVTDTLGIVDGVVTSLVAGDNGFGSLIWTGLDTTTVSFVIGNLPDSLAFPALAIDQFAISEVPLPPAFFMMFGGIVLLNLLKRSGRHRYQMI